MAVLDGKRYIVNHRDIAISLCQAPQLDRRHAQSSPFFLALPVFGEWRFFYEPVNAGLRFSMKAVRPSL